jgi:hypothetical protein
MLITANTGAVPSLSGGDIFYHWDFKSLRDGPIMESQLRRLVTRKTGYNCTLRVRASNGWVLVTSPTFQLKWSNVCRAQS